MLPRRACLLVALFFLSPAQAVADFSGRVVGVSDGDTLTVLHNSRGEKIRLNGIDCPEKAQVYGHKAKNAASALVFGKGVTVQTFGQDKYRRTIGEVILPDGKSLNQELVRDGMCWWYRKYAPSKRRLRG